MLLEFADASKTLSKQDADVSSKLCEVAKAFLNERAKQFVKAHQGRPVLMSYQSDGTPMLAKQTHTAKRSSGQLVVRKAGRGIELLLQKVFLKTLSPTGGHVVSCYFRDRGLWIMARALGHVSPLLACSSPCSRPWGTNGSR